MDIILIILGVVIVVLLIVSIILSLRKSGPGINSTEIKALGERLIRVEGEISKINPSIDRNFRENRKEIADNLSRMQVSNAKSLEQVQNTTARSLEQMQNTTARSIEQLRTGNEKKLEEMRETVDEKLRASVEKRFNESFKTISTQLTQVYEGCRRPQKSHGGCQNARNLRRSTTRRNYRRYFEQISIRGKHRYQTWQ